MLALTIMSVNDRRCCNNRGGICGDVRVGLGRGMDRQVSSRSHESNQLSSSEMKASSLDWFLVDSSTGLIMRDG